MSAARAWKESLRQEQAESSRLVWALAISLALHLLFGGGYYLGNKYHVWQTLHWPTWLKPLQKLVQRLQPRTNPPTQPPPQREPPLMFVNVNPIQEVAEPPKEAKFYSNKNSRAANPEATQDTDTPKISGKQTDMVKTEDVPQEKYLPLQPVRPAPPAPSPKPAQPPQPAPKTLTAQQEQEEQKPKAAQAPGDLAMAKPEPTPRTGEGDAPKPKKARTLAEVRARQPENQLPSTPIKQEGGVRRRLEIASLDAKATPFGAYDAMLVEAICQRWYSLLDERPLAVDSRGKVVVQFELHSDGHVTGVNVSENTTSEVQGFLCLKAVQDPAPYKEWPEDMRRMMEKDVRKVQFTFFYYY